MTAAEQWRERTLDDSANRRLSIAEGFLCADAVLALYLNVASGLVVNEKVIEKNLLEELPFMATENILMDAVKRGGDRQALHERIRVHAMEAGARVKQQGAPCDLLDRIAADEAFKTDRETLEKNLAPSGFIGCAKWQTEDYIENVVAPLLKKYEHCGAKAKEISV